MSHRKLLLTFCAAAGSHDSSRYWHSARYSKSTRVVPFIFRFIAAFLIMNIKQPSRVLRMRSSPQKPAVTKKCRPAAGRIGVNFLGAPSVSSRHMTHEMNVYFFVSLSGRNSPPNSRGSSRWGQKKSLFFAAHLPSGGRRIRILNFWYKWDFFSLCSVLPTPPPILCSRGEKYRDHSKSNWVLDWVHPHTGHPWSHFRGLSS